MNKKLKFLLLVIVMFVIQVLLTALINFFWSDDSNIGTAFLEIRLGLCLTMLIVSITTIIFLRKLGDKAQNTEKNQPE